MAHRILCTRRAHWPPGPAWVPMFHTPTCIPCQSCTTQLTWHKHSMSARTSHRAFAVLSHMHSHEVRTCTAQKLACLTEAGSSPSASSSPLLLSLLSPLAARARLRDLLANCGCACSTPCMRVNCVLRRVGVTCGLPNVLALPSRTGSMPHLPPASLTRTTRHVEMVLH